jgi:hypothetical protein
MTWFCEKDHLIMTTTLYEVEFLLEERFGVGARRWGVGNEKKGEVGLRTYRPALRRG